MALRAYSDIGEGGVEVNCEKTLFLNDPVCSYIHSSDVLLITLSLNLRRTRSVGFIEKQIFFMSN